MNKLKYMNSPTIRSQSNALRIPHITFESDEDVRQYLDFLMENGLDYHLDDSPVDIQWNHDLTPDQIDQLQGLHCALWDYCDPWIWLDDPENDGYWIKYSKQEEE